MTSKYKVTYQVVKTESAVIEVDCDDFEKVRQMAYELCKKTKDIDLKAEVTVNKIAPGKMFPMVFFDDVESLINDS